MVELLEMVRIPIMAGTWSPGLRWRAVRMTSERQTDERATWVNHVGVNPIVPRSVRKQGLSDNRGRNN